MNCKRVGVIGSLAIGVTLVGCGLEGLVGGMAQNFEYAKKIEVHPEYTGLANESVAVIVQTDMATMYEYPNVDLLMASGVAGRLQMHVEGVRVLDPRLVNSWQFRTPQWSALAFGEMAERLNVNRIVYIDVYEYRLNPPGNRYLWDGVCAANVSIIERDSYDPDMFVDTFNIVTAFPDMEGVGRESASAAQIQDGVLAKFIEHSAWLFYTHLEPKYPDKYHKYQ